MDMASKNPTANPNPTANSTPTTNPNPTVNLAPTANPHATGNTAPTTNIAVGVKDYTNEVLVFINIHNHNICLLDSDNHG
jgi:hypothetical protein